MSYQWLLMTFTLQPMKAKNQLMEVSVKILLAALTIGLFPLVASASQETRHDQHHYDRPPVYRVPSHHGHDDYRRDQHERQESYRSERHDSRGDRHFYAERPHHERHVERHGHH